jgi:hypothetical protein
MSIASSYAEYLKRLPRGCCNGFSNSTLGSALERLSLRVTVLAEWETANGSGREESSIINSKIQSVFDPMILYLISSFKRKARLSISIVIASLAFDKYSSGVDGAARVEKGSSFHRI